MLDSAQVNRRTPLIGPMHRAALSLGVIAALLTAPCRASAQSASASNAATEEITVFLELRAPERCGKSDDLVRRVELRSDRIRFVGAAGASRRLEAVLQPSRAGVTATLALVQVNGRRSSRSVRARSCDEALDALALVATVMLDPAADIGGEHDPAATTAETPPGGPTDSSAGGGRTDPARPNPGATSDPTTGKPDRPGQSPGTRRAKPETRPRDSALDAGTAIDEPGDARDSTSEPFRLTGSLGGAAHAVSGVAPSVLPGGGLYGTLSLERGSLLAPFARVSVTHHSRGGFEHEWGTASFELETLTVELCPARLGSPEVALRGCVLASGGLLRPSGSNTVQEEKPNRPWSAVGLSALLVVQPHGLLELIVSASVARPLVRDAIGFSNAAGTEQRVIHRVPTLTGGAALGVGLRFQ